MPRSLAGLRIRERRTELGLTQAELAKRAGISSSYLNLIERNRRGAAGRVLLGLARALGVSPSDLSGGPEQGLIADLQEAAAARGAAPAQAEEIVGRFPDWARAMAAERRENRALRGAITALSDRLAHDPVLARAVHALLSRVTAIRSAADILTEAGAMEADERARFLAIVREESGRLSDAAQELVRHFDRAERDPAAAATPEEALDRFAEAHGHVFPALEEDAGALERLIAHPLLATAPARAAARAHLDRYAADAAALPLGPFAAAAAALGHDPAALARRFGVPLLAAMRRLAVLRREGLPAPVMGYVEADAAGNIALLRPVEGVPIGRHGPACALWPLWEALALPGRPLAARCRMPDGSEVLALAAAEPAVPPAFAAEPRWHTGMLALPMTEARATALAPLATAGPPREVGPGCRLCPREECPARAAPSILS